MSRKRLSLALGRHAEKEIEEATDYFEGERKGLGATFQATLHATFDRIVRFPESFSTVLVTRDGYPVRRALTHPFSYMVVYVELPRALRVVAVAHTKRRPLYWRRLLRRECK